jgi:hypothetical protein
MDEGTWSTVLGTFRKAPSLVGANVVTEIKKKQTFWHGKVDLLS